MILWQRGITYQLGVQKFIKVHNTGVYKIFVSSLVHTGFRPKHQRQPVLPLHGENESPGWKACGLWASCEGLLSGQGRVASPHLSRRVAARNFPEGHWENWQRRRQNKHGGQILGTSVYMFSCGRAKICFFFKSPMHDVGKSPRIPSFAMLGRWKSRTAELCEATPTWWYCDQHGGPTTGDTPKFHKAMCVAVTKMRHFFFIFSQPSFFFSGYPPFSDEPTWFMYVHVHFTRNCMFS